MREPYVNSFVPLGHGRHGAVVVRSDGTSVTAKLVVGPDGALCVKPPPGEWLHEPPTAQIDGQMQFVEGGTGQP